MRTCNCEVCGNWAGRGVRWCAECHALGFDGRDAKRAQVAAAKAAAEAPVPVAVCNPLPVVPVAARSARPARRAYKVCPVCGCTSDDRTFTTLGTVCDDCA